MIKLALNVWGGFMDFWKIMSESLSDNMLIIIGAVADFIILIISLCVASSVSKHFKAANGIGLKKSVYYLLDISYTVFIAIISMFPLLGMFGTVVALIELGGVFQTDTADMEAIKPEFFLALTSTAWGIIFSLIYKFVNSIFQSFIENQIEKAKKDLKI